MKAIKAFFQKNREWKVAVPLILVMFIINVVIRSTEYRRFHEIHTIFTYLQYFVFFVGIFLSLVRYKKTILANLALLCSLLFALETIFFLWLGMPYKPLYSFSTKNLESSEKLYQLGYLPTPGQVTNEVKMRGKDTLFNVDYTIDKYHRRIIPKDTVNRDAFALFLGCSVTYGYGVEDNENMPYFFQKHQRKYKPYNYGYNGYGTQNVLAHLERMEIREEIPESDGIAVYVFLWSHILRSIGDMPTYSWGWRLPYYKPTKAGVVRKGNFADDRKLVSFFYEWALGSSIVKYFRLSFPLSVKDSHLELTADIIEQARNKYQDKFGNERFYVLIFPEDFSQFDPSSKKKFRAMLKERKVNILDGYEKVLVLDEAHKVPGDPHPNGLAHEKIARQLAKDIDQVANP